MSFLVPELHLLKDTDERIRALQFCRNAIRRRTILLFVLLMIVGPLGIFIYPGVLLWPRAIRIGGAFVFGCLVGFGYLWLCRSRLQRPMREYLNSSGMRVCMDCGYNLTGNVSGVCPECGEQI